MKKLSDIIEASLKSSASRDKSPVKRDTVPVARRGGLLSDLPDPHGRHNFKAQLRFEILVPNRQVAVSHLWGHLLKSKKFKTSHWYFLFRDTERLKGQSTLGMILRWGLLKLSTQRKLVNNFNVNHHPVESFLQGGPVTVSVGDLGVKEMTYDTVFDLCWSVIGIPKKLAQINNLIEFSIREVESRRAREVSRIGVGYKDKGTLGGPRSVELGDVPYDPDDFLVDEPTVEWLLEKFDVLLETNELKL